MTFTHSLTITLIHSLCKSSSTLVPLPLDLEVEKLATACYKYSRDKKYRSLIGLLGKANNKIITWIMIIECRGDQATEQSAGWIFDRLGDTRFQLVGRRSKWGREAIIVRKRRWCDATIDCDSSCFASRSPVCVWSIEMVTSDVGWRSHTWWSPATSRSPVESDVAFSHWCAAG
jgi:hypothetical protein